MVGLGMVVGYFLRGLGTQNGPLKNVLFVERKWYYLIRTWMRRDDRNCRTYVMRYPCMCHCDSCMIFVRRARKLPQLDGGNRNRSASKFECSYVKRHNAPLIQQPYYSSLFITSHFSPVLSFLAPPQLLLKTGHLIIILYMSD